MNAIEIRGLRKCFRGLPALDGLDMTVPQGAIYGFIGENGSGKSTTEKILCGHLVPDEGRISLFGRDGKGPGVRSRIGALIENAGCFPESSVHANLMMQCINLGIKDKEKEIDRVLRIVRMEKEKRTRFRSCSLGMKQRIGIARALLGDPALLILDEPINGLDGNGIKIMREILLDITRNAGCTVLISSHILGELEKIATHYGIIRQGRMIQELSATELEGRAKVMSLLQTDDDDKAIALLQTRYKDVRKEGDHIVVYKEEDTGTILAFLLDNGREVHAIRKNRIGLEEYYVELMSRKED